MDGFMPADLEQVLQRIDQITARFASPPAPEGSPPRGGAFGEVLDGAHAAMNPAALNQAVQKAASSSGVDPNLVAAVMQAESGGDPSATSRKGAMGLMQLMPGTAKDLGVSDPYDPTQNLAGGARFLRSMLDQFGGDLPSAIAAYNAGPEPVAKAHGVPDYPETQHYVKRVLDLYRQNLGQNQP